MQALTQSTFFQPLPIQFAFIFFLLKLSLPLPDTGRTMPTRQTVAVSLWSGCVLGEIRTDITELPQLLKNETVTNLRLQRLTSLYLLCPFQCLLFTHALLKLEILIAVFHILLDQTMHSV